jgi:glycosyltransferase involved in cell wall biosynthesis
VALKRAPAVSICLTAYNRPDGLRLSLASLLWQTFTDFEILVADDSEGEEVADVAREFAASDSRVSFERNERRLGMPRNLNAAIRRATGEFVANLHDADEFREDLLRRWVAALQGDPDAAFVFNDYLAIDYDGTKHLCHEEWLPDRFSPGELVHLMLFRWGSPVWGTVMARKRTYEEEGLFNPRYGMIADVEMWMRLNIRYPVRYVSEPLIILAPQALGRDYGGTNWDVERALLSLHEEFADRMGGGAVTVAERRRRLRRMRDTRWLRRRASAARRGDWRRVNEGIRIFWREDSAMLRLFSMALSPLLLATPRVGEESWNRVDCRTGKGATTEGASR